MILRPPRSTRTDTLFPYTTLFRSALGHCPCLSAGRLRKAAAGQHPVALTLFHLSARRAADHAAAATAAPGPRARRIKEKEPRCQRIAALGRHSSEARRVGKECGSQGRIRGSPYNYKKKRTSNIIT